MAGLDLSNGENVTEIERALRIPVLDPYGGSQRHLATGSLGHRARHG
jgi:hypothetical protein